MQIEEQIQRDIDEICQFGHYSVSVAYKTLIADKDELKKLRQENEELNILLKHDNDSLAKYNLFKDIEVQLAESVNENTKLKERNNYIVDLVSKDHKQK